MASGVYNQFKTELMKGTFDLVNDTVKCALMDTGFSFDVTQINFSNTFEISGTGYTAGGAALASKTVTQDDTDNEGVFDAADTAWTTATFSAYFACIWDDTPTSPADPVICCIDFGGVQTVTSGTFTIQWAAEGIVNIT